MSAIKNHWRKHQLSKKGPLGFIDPCHYVECKDGFSFSAQAGYGIYSEPREFLESGEYESFELGYPSESDPLIIEFAESESDPTRTVYPYVPAYIVDQLIEKRGGIKKDES